MKKYLVILLLVGCGKSIVPAPTGGVPLGEYVNVKELGAKGDGITDDTKAF